MQDPTYTLHVYKMCRCLPLQSILSTLCTHLVGVGLGIRFMKSGSVGVADVAVVSLVARFTLDYIIISLQFETFTTFDIKRLGVFRSS